MMAAAEALPAVAAAAAKWAALAQNNWNLNQLHFPIHTKNDKNLDFKYQSKNNLTLT